MRILVAGRTGQVAMALAEVAGPHVVRALGRPQLDLTAPASPAEALAAERPDLVVNAAAYTSVDRAETDEAAAHALNAAGADHLARACAASGTPLIHLSTDYVFDGTLGRPYSEDDPLAPLGVYGRTKAAGEEAVRAAGGPALVVRTSWVHSPFGANFVRTMLRVGAERERVRVVADQTGCPTSALDLARALIALAERVERWPAGVDTVHLCGAGEATWHALAEATFRQAGLDVVAEPITTADYPTAARRPADSRLDVTKARERYGVALRDWRDGLAEVVERLTGSGVARPEREHDQRPGA